MTSEKEVSRICKKCEQEKLITEFRVQHYGDKNCYSRACRSCLNQISKEKLLARMKDPVKREIIIAQQKTAQIKYRLKNKEKNQST